MEDRKKRNKDEDDARNFCESEWRFFCKEKRERKAEKDDGDKVNAKTKNGLEDSVEGSSNHAKLAINGKQHEKRNGEIDHGKNFTRDVGFHFEMDAGACTTSPTTAPMRRMIRRRTGNKIDEIPSTEPPFTLQHTERL